MAKQVAWRLGIPKAMEENDKKMIDDLAEQGAPGASDLQSSIRGKETRRVAALRAAGPEVAQHYAAPCGTRGADAGPRRRRRADCRLDAAQRAERRTPREARSVAVQARLSALAAAVGLAP
eukprot:13763450-Alexandrium_andersonii.AAC.1